ncbi:VWA domain-containing protein [Leptolyngbya sp. 7M]|nr:VWA domain-containing protein [Leptolyngbya sp. 7M]QYO66898.1 VWA domain-containing protein [Leptolyngbya sp. 7M]
MKRVALALALLGSFTFFAVAQADRSTRPRVAPTPAPQIVERYPGSGSRPDAPPVLVGGQTRPTSTPDPVSNDDDEVIRIETNLVTMPVSVLDRDGRFISGLTERDFQIFENGKQQKIEYFQSTEQPFTVALLIDVSPSTAFRMDEIHNAAILFVEQLRPSDRVMVISFDERMRVLTPPTNNRNELRYAIRQAQWGNGTSLYEAVDRTLKNELARIEGRKAIVLFTDGVDTTSRRASYQSTLNETEEGDALIYLICFSIVILTSSGGLMFLTSTRVTFTPHLSVASSRIIRSLELISSREERVWSRSISPMTERIPVIVS